VTNVAVRLVAITGNKDFDMLNAAIADGTANGGVPGVMYTERGGPFTVTAIGTCSHNVAITYPGWAWFDQIVDSNSCTTTTFPIGTRVIAFGAALDCRYPPFDY
jgi:hypothetical protein